MSDIDDIFDDIPVDPFDEDIDLLLAPEAGEIAEMAALAMQERQAEINAQDAAKRAERSAALEAKRIVRRAERQAARSAAQASHEDRLRSVADAHCPANGWNILFRAEGCSVRSTIEGGRLAVVVPEPVNASTLYRCLLGFARAHLEERAPTGELRRPSWQCLWQAHELAASWMAEADIALAPATLLSVRRRISHLMAKNRRPQGGTARREWDAAAEFALIRDATEGFPNMVDR